MTNTLSRRSHTRIERISMTAIRFEVYTITIVRDVAILLDDIARSYAIDLYFAPIVARLRH